MNMQNLFLNNLQNTIKQVGLTNINGTLNPLTAEYTFYSRNMEYLPKKTTFKEIKHVLINLK